jgi:hypothetical protein
MFTECCVWAMRDFTLGHLPAAGFVVESGCLTF